MSSNWKALTIAEAQVQNCDITIALATIEAETSGNNEINSIGAVGYGQIMCNFHYDAFQYASKRLGISIPSSGDIQGLQTLTLQNDSLSIIIAVYVIKQYWYQANGNFNKFTLLYEGPASTDTARRYAIYQKYQGTSTADIAGSSNGSTATDVTGLTIPATNYSILANSKKVSGVLYGRRYRVIVSNKNGNALDVSQLRCVFNIQKTMVMQANYSTVTIYNLSADTENNIINEGHRIVVEAGYEGQQYGLIFDGTVVQPIRDKEDGVTYKLTLNSLDGDGFLNGGVVNFSLVKGQTARNIAENLVSKATSSTSNAVIGSISNSMSSSQLTRGKACFGLAKDYLRQLSQSQNSTFYVDDGKVNIIHMADLPEGEIVELSPSSGLIGVPAQTEYGVSGKCLMNPSVKLNTLVHIDNSLVHDMQAQVRTVIRSLDTSGIYRVIKVNYIGDTRGDDWFTVFDTVSQAGMMPSMMANSSTNPN